LSQYQTTDDNKVLPNNSRVHSLTVPHKSLDKNEVVPWTLAAIKADFNFEQLVFLNIKPKQRSLEVGYSCPEITISLSQNFSIKIETLPETILNSLRDRKSIIINSQDTKNIGILKQFCVGEFLIAPVLNENRLVALLYLDNYKNKQPIAPRYLPQLAPIIHELGVALTHAKRFELEKKRAEMDGLTGLFNKRMVIGCLETAFQLNENKLNQLAIGFIDIDFFKKFNDNCGHQAGDDVLKIVAQIMRTLTRPGDFIGRYGGEEFVFVLFNTTSKGASSYAERIRLEIERKGKILSQRFQGCAMTVSIGVSLYNPKFNTYNQMIEAADSAMYTAKEQGRNCIVVA
jgi:diguanylate cyclase (GGDEF)-like protein